MCSLTETNHLLEHLIVLPTKHTFSSSSLCAVFACDFLRQSQQNSAFPPSSMPHEHGTFTCLYYDGSPACLSRFLSCFFFWQALILCATWRFAASSCHASRLSCCCCRMRSSQTTPIFLVLAVLWCARAYSMETIFLVVSSLITGLWPSGSLKSVRMINLRSVSVHIASGHSWHWERRLAPGELHGCPFWHGPECGGCANWIYGSPGTLVVFQWPRSTSCTTRSMLHAVQYVTAE